MLYIVDDDEAICDALSWLAKSCDIATQCYGRAHDFLSVLDQWVCAPEGDCLLLDVRMPELNGLALFDILQQRSWLQRLPVIFLTGHADVPMAVDSLKRGAFDFFEKPFNDNALMQRVREAFAASREAQGKSLVEQRLASLSQREREVMDHILAGKMNKVIADDLGISMRTVEVHRAHIFDKMQVKTAVDLARLLSS